jgi:hypothetical protein
LIEKKGYKGELFPLLIPKEEEVKNPTNKEGVGSPTTNPERTTTNQLNSNRKGSQTQKQTSNSRQWWSPMTPEELQTSRAFPRAARSSFKWQNGSKSPNPRTSTAINRRRTVAQPEKPKTKHNNNIKTGK